MMILTPRKLKEILTTLYGKDFIRPAAKRLRKSEKTISRWVKDETAFEAELRHELHDIIFEQIGVLGQLDAEIMSDQLDR